MEKILKRVREFTPCALNKFNAIIPTVLTAVLVLYGNSTTCWIVNQPKAPESLRKYRKF